MYELLLSLYWILLLLDLAGSLNLAVKSRTKPAGDLSPLDGSMRPPAEVCFLFIKLWHFSYGLKLFFPRLFFVTYFPFKMCTAFFYGIFKCLISSEVERQFCFIVLTYFSFQLFSSRSHLKSFIFSKTFIFIQVINCVLCRTRVIPAALHEKCIYWVTLQSRCEICYCYTQFTTYFTSILH